MASNTVIKQGKSIGLNAEFVTTDLMQFDMLARQVLLKRTGMTNRQLIDACLKMEQIYTGALYVPYSGDVTCFVRLRRSYQSKFIDCMVRGIDLSIEENDLPSATWLVEASLTRANTRGRGAARHDGIQPQRQEARSGRTVWQPPVLPSSRAAYGARDERRASCMRTSWARRG